MVHGILPRVVWRAEMYDILSCLVLCCVVLGVYDVVFCSVLVLHVALLWCCVVHTCFCVINIRCCVVYLRCVVLWCGLMCIVWCGVVWCMVSCLVWCGVWCGAVWCGVVLCGLVWCGVVCGV